MAFAFCFADSSFSELSKTAGISWLIESDALNLRRFRSMPLHQQVSSNSHAELFALALAVIDAAGLTTLQAGDSLLVHSDSKWALSTWVNRDTCLRGLRRVLDEAYAAVEAKGLVVYLSHVKAHTGRQDLASLGNAYVDREARYAFRRAVEAFG